MRAAIFNMILSQAGSGSTLPPNARWLDLFAGTGSVGLEALSRGASLTHFVEMDPWVCKKILGNNISTCGFSKKSVVHTSGVEDFLRKAKELPRFAGEGWWLTVWRCGTEDRVQSCTLVASEPAC